MNFQLHKKKVKILTNVRLVFATWPLYQQELKTLTAFQSLLMLTIGYFKTTFIKQMAGAQQSEGLPTPTIW